MIIESDRVPRNFRSSTRIKTSGSSLATPLCCCTATKRAKARSRLVISDQQFDHCRETAANDDGAQDGGRQLAPEPRAELSPQQA